MGVLVNNEHDNADSGLCAGTQSNLGGRVLGEEEKHSFIALPGKGGPQRDHAFKTCVSQLWGTW